MIPSVEPSKEPSSIPSLLPTTSKEPSSLPTHLPTPIFSLQRAATIAVEIGLKGLKELDVICSGIGAFLKQGIKDVYGPETISTVTCLQRQGLRNLASADMIYVRPVFDYEKPVMITVTTIFDNYNLAPRYYAFAEFLEQLIVSDKAQRELPEYIQTAEGGIAFSDGVHVRLVFTPKQEPLLILGFGEDSPTPSPTANATIERNENDSTVDQDGGGSPSGVMRELRLRQSLVVCTVLGGFMKMLL